MHINSLNEIRHSKTINKVMKGKYYLGSKSIDTRGAEYFHVFILWFDARLSDKRIETIRRKLFSEKKTNGECLDIPDIIKFYGTIKQLVIS